MRTHLLLAALLVLGLAGCGGEDKPTGGGGAAPVPASAPTPPPAPAKPTLDASSPKALAESIFAIAKSGDLASLSSVADPKDSDGDSKQVANVAQAPADKQANFREHFGPGSVSGEVKVEGDMAEVPILFGPDGKRPETFKMVKRDGRWYLQSF
jgi:hypothetical protein